MPGTNKPTVNLLQVLDVKRKIIGNNLEFVPCTYIDYTLQNKGFLRGYFCSPNSMLSAF